ncbi:MAG: DUF488 family protein [Reyranellaceae bacterium]
MTGPLMTIGYENAALGDFLDTLVGIRVGTVIDIRELPLSRRAGFSKSTLSAALAARGIDYVHLRGLGDPKEGREAARAGDYRTFVQIFRRHLRTAIAKSDLERACELVQSERVCLLCYELDAARCHRTIVAEEISGIVGNKICHLAVSQKNAPRRTERKRARADSGKGAASCRASAR